MTRANFVDNHQHVMKLKNLLRVLVLSFAGETLTPIDMAHLTAEKFGIAVDWHEYSSVMDVMYMKGEIEHAGFRTGMMNKYRIPEVSNE